MNLRDVLGLAGCLLLLAGIFMPLVKVPILGPMTYFRIAEEGALIMLALVGGSFALLLAHRYRYLSITGTASLVVMAFSLVRSEAGAGGRPMQQLTNLANRTLELQWGLAVMVAGALLLIAAAVARRRRR